MTHEDAGHYAAKHPVETIDQSIAEAIAEKEKDGRITCAAAHAIARKLVVSAGRVGINIDLLEKRIRRCQLGLFGYDRKKSNKVTPAGMVTKDLENAIRNAMDETTGENRISCEAAWQVAKKMGLTRLELASACEALHIKVKKCQLGAF